MVTVEPGTPLVVEMPETDVVATENATGFEVFDQTPPCCTLIVPVVELGATVTTICVSLQLTTVARVLPTHTVPRPCTAPNPVPVIVTCAPGAPLEVETEITLAVPAAVTV